MAESLFVGGYEENYHKLAERFRPYGFAEIIEKGGEKVRETGMYSLQENRIYKRRKIHFFRPGAGGGVPNRKRQRDKESQNDFYGKDRRNA